MSRSKSKRPFSVSPDSAERFSRAGRVLLPIRLSASDSKMTHLKAKGISRSAPDVITVANKQVLWNRTTQDSVRGHWAKAKGEQDHTAGTAQARLRTQSARSNAPVLTGDHNVSLLIQHHYHRNHGEVPACRLNAGLQGKQMTRPGPRLTTNIQVKGSHKEERTNQLRESLRCGGWAPRVHARCGTPLS